MISAASSREPRMIRFARLALTLATALALAACSSSGPVHDGYDANSPGASHGEACSEIPPSPYCSVRRH
jgi:hypothetical protein